MTTGELTNSAAEAEDDVSLVRRVLTGDPMAFAALMRRFNRRLYRLARAIVRDGAEAEDALQEAYLHAYRSLGRFRGESSLATWLSRLVVNECLGRMRRRTRRENVIPMTPAPADREIEAVPSDEVGSPDVAEIGRAHV